MKLTEQALKLLNNIETAAKNQLSQLSKIESAKLITIINELKTNSVPNPEAIALIELPSQLDNIGNRTLGNKQIESLLITGMTDILLQTVQCLIKFNEFEKRWVKLIRDGSVFAKI